MYKMQTYTFVFDHKPTQKEAMQAMATKLVKVQEKYESLTYRAAAQKYIDSKKNVLSPSTIRGTAVSYGKFPMRFLIIIFTILPRLMYRQKSTGLLRIAALRLCAIITAFYRLSWALFGPILNCIPLSHKRSKLSLIYRLTMT